MSLTCSSALKIVALTAMHLPGFEGTGMIAWPSLLPLAQRLVA
jgi:hypothetical protein